VKLVESGFEMIEADTEAMSNSEFIHFEAVNKANFAKSKKGGVPRTDGKIAPPPPNRQPDL